MCVDGIYSYPFPHRTTRRFGQPAPCLSSSLDARVCYSSNNKSISIDQVRRRLLRALALGTPRPPPEPASMADAGVVKQKTPTNVSIGRSWTQVLAYVLLVAFVCFTATISFTFVSPASLHSPWLDRFFSASSSAASLRRSQFSNPYSFYNIRPNASFPGSSCPANNAMQYGPRDKRRKINFSARKFGSGDALTSALLECDLYDGKWVKDKSYPLYQQGSCPYVHESFDCYHNGRPDMDYQKLRWQPNGCNIPR